MTLIKRDSGTAIRLLQCESSVAKLRRSQIKKSSSLFFFNTIMKTNKCNQNTGATRLFCDLQYFTRVVNGPTRSGPNPKMKARREPETDLKL